jgi:hypothetical protein
VLERSHHGRNDRFFACSGHGHAVHQHVHDCYGMCRRYA